MSANFTPLAALMGGGLIGLGAALLWLALGRIAGVSGILHGALAGDADQRIWRLLFLLGLPAGAFGAFALGWSARPSAPPADLGLAALAGLLVGLGTRIGSGCTSGHGVCGLARLSPRSLVATLAFMAAGITTASLIARLTSG